MPIRKIARIVNAAYKDADLARRTATSPEFRKAMTKDRRSALSEYATVKYALRDRERILAAKGGERASKDRKPPKPRGNAKTKT